VPTIPVNRANRPVTEGGGPGLGNPSSGLSSKSTRVLRRITNGRYTFTNVPAFRSDARSVPTTNNSNENRPPVYSGVSRLTRFLPKGKRIRFAERAIRTQRVVC